MKPFHLLLLIVFASTMDLCFSSNPCKECYSEDICMAGISQCQDDAFCQCERNCARQIQAVKDDVQKNGGCLQTSIRNLEECMLQSRMVCFGKV